MKLSKMHLLVLTSVFVSSSGMASEGKALTWKGQRPQGSIEIRITGSAAEEIYSAVDVKETKEVIGSRVKKLGRNIICSKGRGGFACDILMEKDGSLDRPSKDPRDT
jgi:hypothetical protein